jgi:hypothetical protein
MCEPGHTCIPDGVCNCGFDDVACITQAVVAAATRFRVECTVPTNMGQRCGTASDTLKVAIPQFQATGANTCDNVRFMALPQAGQPLALPLIDPQSSLVVNNGTRVDFGGTTAGVGCLFALEVRGVPPILPMGANRERAMMIIDASNGFTVVAPLDLIFTYDGCIAENTTCTVVGVSATNPAADTMWNCLRVPPP